MTRADSGKFSKPLRGVSICFDLDGTLVDTAPDLVRVTNEVIAQEGAPETHFKSARAVVGFGSRRLISDALDRAGKTVSPDRLNALQRDFLQRYSETIAHHSEPFPGVVETLRQLKHLGASLNVCTNKPDWLAGPLLEDLAMTHWFDRIVGCDAARAAKPSPLHVFDAAGHQSSRHIVMVGDSWPDMEAAKRAGVLGILVTYGYSHSPQIRLRAGARLRNFRSLTPTLIRHFSAASR